MSNLVLIRPMINEKSMGLIKNSFYTFEVGKEVTKNQVGKAVADQFKVEVVSVNIINLPKKSKTQRSRRGYYLTQGFKKAIVKVKKGQKIAIFESVPEEKKEEVEVRTAEGETIAKTKEKKSLLRGTRVKIEEMTRGQEDLKKSHQEEKKKGEN
ncbi:50S ribosomal protein L23 [Candidatus Daviesbacteria bacterium]|nr:50S ribosomal protein L23 [Candidatus Daviesbacteria bacterium]